MSPQLSTGEQSGLTKPNAFTATGPAIHIKPTVISRKLATRVNKEAFHCTPNATNSQRAPR